MEMDWLKGKNVEYAYKDISVDAEAYKEALEKAHQAVVPITDIDGEIIIGFDREKLERQLKKAKLITA
jgi:glutaredoxin